jgi:predicted ATPase with chaperone activity
LQEGTSCKTLQVEATTMPKKLVAVNAQGHRIGEDNSSAKLTNHEVDLLFQLHEEAGMGCRRLAKKFEISCRQVKRILKGTHRAQSPDHFKSV